MMIRHALITGIASFTIVVALAVLVGWLLDIALLKSVIPGSVTMKSATALSFLFSGIIVFFTHRREQSRSDWASIMLPSAVLSLLILMGVLLASVLFNFRSGVELLFVREGAGAVLTTVPGQPSVGTMTAFILIAILGAIALSAWHGRFKAYLALGIVVALLGATALFGYVLNMPILYYTITGKSSAMAIHTAVLFALVGVGFVLIARTHEKNQAEPS